MELYRLAGGSLSGVHKHVRLNSSGTIFKAVQINGWSQSVIWRRWRVWVSLLLLARKRKRKRRRKCIWVQQKLSFNALGVKQRRHEAEENKHIKKWSLPLTVSPVLCAVHYSSCACCLFVSFSHTGRRRKATSQANKQQKKACTVKNDNRNKRFTAVYCHCPLSCGFTKDLQPRSGCQEHNNNWLRLIMFLWLIPSIQTNGIFSVFHILAHSNSETSKSHTSIRTTDSGAQQTKNNFWRQSKCWQQHHQPDWLHENSKKQWLEEINSPMEGKTQSVQNQNHIMQQVINLYNSVVAHQQVSHLVTMIWCDAAAKLPNCFSFLQMPCILSILLRNKKCVNIWITLVF